VKVTPVRFVASFLAVVLGGCIQSTEPRTLGPVAQTQPAFFRSAHVASRSGWGSIHSIHVETRVEVNPRTFVSGSPIEVVVSVTNRSHEPQYVPRCPISYAFFDEAGQYLGPYVVCGASADFIELGVGQGIRRSYTQVGYWAPGRYKVYPYVGNLPFEHPFTVQILPAAGGSTP